MKTLTIIFAALSTHRRISIPRATMSTLLTVSICLAAATCASADTMRSKDGKTTYHSNPQKPGSHVWCTVEWQVNQFGNSYCPPGKSVQLDMMTGRGSSPGSSAQATLSGMKPNLTKPVINCYFPPCNPDQPTFPMRGTLSRELAGATWAYVDASGATVSSGVIQTNGDFTLPAPSNAAPPKLPVKGCILRPQMPPVCGANGEPAPTLSVQSKGPLPIKITPILVPVGGFPR